MAPLPKELLDAIESGRLTEEELRQLITLEAESIGLSYEEAIKLAKERRLPKSPIGLDIEALIQLLAA